MSKKCIITFLIFTCAVITVFAGVLPEEPLLIRLPMAKQKSSLKTLQSKRDTKLYNEYGSIYLVDVAVGTPPQVFKLEVDTGR